MLIRITFAAAFGFFCLGVAGQGIGLCAGKQGARAAEEQTLLQQQARMYRARGLALQEAGNLLEARAFYQKAIQLDPQYAVPYNDLGVLYENAGEFARAERSYITSLKLDPNYLSPYTNLAIFYEGKRDLVKAAQYWKKRMDLGVAGDPWVEKARRRYEDILLVLGRKPEAEEKEQHMASLMREVEGDKYLFKRDNKVLAQHHFTIAKRTLDKGDEVAALSQAIDAQQLDPSNRAITDFVEKLQKRLLTR